MINRFHVLSINEDNQYKNEDCHVTDLSRETFHSDYVQN